MSFSEDRDHLVAVQSPFAGAMLDREAQGSGAPVGTLVGQSGLLESPFSGSFGSESEYELDQEVQRVLLNELEDEEFEDALQGLVDGAASRSLRSLEGWSAETGGPLLSSDEAEAVIAEAWGQSERFLESLEAQYSGVNFETFSAELFEAEVGRQLGLVGPSSPPVENFLKGLARKAKGLVKGAVKVAKAGLKAVGKILPIGKIFGALRKLVRPLLQRVLKVAIKRIPSALQPVAKQLAKKLLGQKEAEFPVLESADMAGLAHEFDASLSEVVLQPGESNTQRLAEELESPGNPQDQDGLALLDARRARLVQGLKEASPGSAPVDEIEQFIPAVMAVLPIVKIGISMIGRKKVVNFIAKGLAGLIQGHVGSAAARQIARPIVDIGLKLLSLEAPNPAAQADVGAEALAATIEDTIAGLAELPIDASDLPRLEAELQEAFAEAAARHLPRAMLDASLPSYENDQEQGHWIYMPRHARPIFRYKRYSQDIPLRISLPTARAVVFPAGDTLEARLRDAGVSRWPAEAELQLFETLPGTHFGHFLTEDEESSGTQDGGQSLEFEEFTPTVAGTLTRQPGLGKQNQPGGRKRLMRLVVQGRGLRRQRRFLLRLDAQQRSPRLTVSLRLSEREAHEMAKALSRQSVAQALVPLRSKLGQPFQAALGRRLEARLAKAAVGQTGSQGGGELAAALTNRLLETMSRQLPTAKEALIQAVKAPDQGVTLQFVFAFEDQAALASGTPPEPKLEILAGSRRG